MRQTHHGHLIVLTLVPVMWRWLHQELLGWDGTQGHETTTGPKEGVNDRKLALVKTFIIDNHSTYRKIIWYVNVGTLLENAAALPKCATCYYLFFFQVRDVCSHSTPLHPGEPSLMAAPWTSRCSARRCGRMCVVWSVLIAFVFCVKMRAQLALTTELKLFTSYVMYITHFVWLRIRIVWRHFCLKIEQRFCRTRPSNS